MRTAQFTVWHDCPFSQPLRESTDLRITHLCHRGQHAYLEIHAHSPEALERVVTYYRALAGEPVHVDPHEPTALVRFPDCLCCQRGQVIPRVERCEALYLPPSSYTLEGEVYRFLISDSEGSLLQPALDDLRRRTESVALTLHSVDSLGFDGATLVPVTTLFGRLTHRQRAALGLATAAGYYRVPRHVRTEDLARQMGISRPGFEKLLRRAESLVMLAALPYIHPGRPAEPATADQPNR